MASQIEQLPDLTGVPKVGSQPQWQRVQVVPPDARQRVSAIAPSQLTTRW